ncbi:transposable element Tcb1 transposase [Trichonephila clavipes]|nr:transposable element Tcb1 transposase [Trichonephila clavipes]
MTDRRGRSHPSRCTTARDDWRIVCTTVRNHETYHSRFSLLSVQSASARTIQHRLQQSGISARRPLLRLPLPGNHRRLRRQWCDERRIWTTERNLFVFTDKSRFYLQHHNGSRHRGKRQLNCCVMHLHRGPALGIMVLNGTGF